MYVLPNDSTVFWPLREYYAHHDYQRAVRLVYDNSRQGEPLPRSTRRLLSGYLQHDFDAVRVHTDWFAQKAAGALGARAFTVEHDIYFGRGQYEPDYTRGLHLLAHELVHVVQQCARGGAQTANEELLEAEAERAVSCGLDRSMGFSEAPPMILREPTYPRRTTGHRMIREVERILSETRTPDSGDETLRMWSRVRSNFPANDTVGTLARRVWTHLFLRHFVDPDPRPGVESAYPRYFYSHVYRWIDAQHFFGFIDFAEQQSRRPGRNQQQAFDAATQQGVDIEQDQQRIRDYVILGRPTEAGVVRHMQVRPPNTPAFRAPQAVAGGAAFLGAQLAASLVLGGTQGELFAMLNGSRRQKFFLDSARSAFSYEDIVSNQLGTRFFFEQGQRLNGLRPGAIESAFRSELASFFSSIHVENDAANVDRLATESGLPSKERMLAPTADEQRIRQQHPELFQLP